MNASPSPSDQASTQALPTGTSLLSILPYHHLSSTGFFGGATNPGLVSPTDSHATLRKEVLPSPPITSHATPVLHSYGPGLASQPNQEHTTDPAPIIPRPPDSALLPKIPSYPSNAAVTADLAVGGPVRLNKFVRRLHDMLVAEKGSGIIEWKRGLLVLYSTDAFTKKLLPKYFNTRNFKTFRRQLNYYSFIHVKSFSATGSSTTALWINQELARDEANDDISAVLKLRRVEPHETAKTVEGRRRRKESALYLVEEDIGLDSKKLQLDQIRSMAIRGEDCGPAVELVLPASESRPIDIPRVVHVPSLSSDDEEQPRPLLPVSNPIENSAVAANVLLMLARS